jgi:hypothetical protein
MNNSLERVEHDSNHSEHNSLENELHRQLSDHIRSASNHKTNPNNESTIDALDFTADIFGSAIVSPLGAATGMVKLPCLLKRSLGEINHLYNQANDVIQTQFASHPFSERLIEQQRHSVGFGVNQAAHGDCWFEAALAGLLNSPNGPKAISSMITSNPKGGYTVLFPGDILHPINVTSQDIKASQLTNRAQWAQVIEAALIKYLPGEAEHGAAPNRALRLLTGRNSDDKMVFNQSLATLGRQLQTTLAGGAIVEATTFEGRKKTASKETRTDFASSLTPVIPNHSYTVVSYDSSGIVTVRNPWGHNIGTSVASEGATANGVTNIGDGKLKMPLAVFQKYFAYVSTSQAS